MEAEPLAFPQLAFMEEGEREIADGSEMENMEFAVQEFASVTVTVKLPAHREERSSFEDELLQE